MKHKLIENIQRNLNGDYSVVHDYFGAVKLLAETDPVAAHTYNRDVRVQCQIGCSRPGRDQERFYELYKAALLFDAREDFDAYLQYIEFEREPSKRFYLPRRKVLRPLIDAWQQIADDKLDLLGISLAPGVGKSTLGIFGLSWFMGRDPNRPNLASGHADKLTRSFYDGTLSILTDPEYLWGDVFPGSQIATNAKDETIDIGKAKRFKTLTCRSIDGSLTGATRCEGVLYADDLVSGIEEAMSLPRMDRLWEKYTNDLKSRKKLGCKEIHVATRWSPILDTTPVLTVDGWKTHGELQIGDKVFGIDGKPVDVVNTTEPVWCDMVVKTHLEDIVCSGNHIWAVKSRPEYNAVEMTTNEIFERGKPRSVGSISPLQFSQPDPLPIDPYWLGLWLGDGSKKAPVIRCDREIKWHCEETVYDYTVSKNCGNLFYSYTHQGLRGELVKLGLLNNKHIPEIYKMASVHDRLELLAGLIDSDGERIRDCERYRFANTNVQLYEDVRELVTALGFPSRRDEIVHRAGTEGPNGTTRNLDCRRLRFKPTLDVPVRLRYKHVKPQPDYGRQITVEKSDMRGWGKCITTTAQDGVYLVGKTLVPTHNTHDVLGRLERQYEDDPRAKFIKIPALDENDESNFNYDYGVGFDTKYFMDMKNSLDDVSWRCLFQNEPIEREGQLYAEDDLRRYYELPEGEADAVIGICDTAEGGGDDTFLPVARQYGEDWYIDDCVCDDGLPDVTDALCAEVLVRNRVKQCQFESNSAGGRTADKVETLVKQMGGHTHITKRRTTANKQTKIIVNSDFVKKRFVFKDRSRYAPNTPYWKMIQKLCSYTIKGRNKHDDVPDGMAQLAEYIQGMTGSEARIVRRPF